jgi:hypothetical protein
MEYLELPSFIKPNSMSFNLNSNTKSNRSPWTGAVQTSGFRGSYWSVELSISSLTDWESRALEAIIYQLDGMAGRVKLSDLGRQGTQPMGSPVVFGDDQYGSLLNTQGWAASQKVLERGSYLTVGDELKFITQDVWSDINGRATIRIAPQLRRPPQSGSPLEIRNPYGIFMLDSNNSGVDRGPAFKSSMKLKFAEAII